MKRERIETLIKNAMRNKEKMRLGALKVLKAEVQNFEIAQKKTANDSEIEKIAETLIKQMEKSLKIAEDERNREIVNVAKEFLPKQLTKEEAIEALVVAGIRLEDAKTRGAMFGMIKKALGSTVNSETINEVVEIYKEWI
ncbi:MAG: GatB/YqeY domain-containing protein [Sarcina sp.]